MILSRKFSSAFGLRAWKLWSNFSLTFFFYVIHHLFLCRRKFMQTNTNEFFLYILICMEIDTQHKLCVRFGDKLLNLINPIPFQFDKREMHFADPKASTMKIYLDTDNLKLMHYSVTYSKITYCISVCEAGSISVINLWLISQKAVVRAVLGRHRFTHIEES